MTETALAVRQPGQRPGARWTASVVVEPVARRFVGWARHGTPTTDTNVTSDPVATNRNRGLASRKIAVWWPAGPAAVNAAAHSMPAPYAGG